MGEKSEGSGSSMQNAHIKQRGGKLSCNAEVGSGKMTLQKKAMRDTNDAAKCHDSTPRVPMTTPQCPHGLPPPMHYDSAVIIAFIDAHVCTPSKHYKKLVSSSECPILRANLRIDQARRRRHAQPEMDRKTPTTTLSLEHVFVPLNSTHCQAVGADRP
jgi:hypothetical protein